MKKKPIKSKTEQQKSSQSSGSTGLTILNALVTAQDIGGRILMNNNPNPMLKIAVRKKTLLLKLVKELANNPKQTPLDSAAKVAENFVRTYATTKIGKFAKLSFGPILTFDIATDLATAISDTLTNTVDMQAIMAKRYQEIEKIQNKEFQEDSFLHNLEIIESCLTFKLIGDICHTAKTWQGKAIDFLATPSTPDEIKDIWLEEKFNTLSATVGINQLPAEVKTVIADNVSKSNDRYPLLALILHANENVNESSTQDANASSSNKPVSRVDIFGEQFKAINQKIISWFSSSEDLTETLKTTETTVNELVDEQHRLKSQMEQLNPLQSSKNSDEAKDVSKALKLLSPQLFKAGISIADSIFKISKLNRNKNEFEVNKQKIVEEITETLENSGLILSDDRAIEYVKMVQNSNSSINSFRHRAHYLMAEDLTLTLQYQQNNVEKIKNQLSEVDQSLSHLSELKKDGFVQLGKIIFYQNMIKDKIESISHRQLPSYIQSGLQISAQLAVKVSPAAAFLLKGSSYLISLVEGNNQQNDQRRLNTYLDLFNQEEYLADRFKKRLTDIQQNLVQASLNKKLLTNELLSQASGLELLKITKNTIDDVLSQQQEQEAELITLQKKFDSLMSQKKNVTSEYLATTKDKKRNKLHIQIAEINEEFLACDMAMDSLKTTIQNTKTYLSNLSDLYQKEKKLAPIHEWFFTYHESFFGGLDGDNLKLLIEWRKAVKETLSNVNLLHAESDAAASGLASEISLLIEPLHKLGMHRTAKYFGYVTQSFQAGYGLYRAVDGFATAISVINAARREVDANGAVSSVDSFIRACSKMGLAFNVTHFVTPIVTSFNLGLRLIDTIFGLKLFENPAMDRLQHSVNQIPLYFELLTKNMERMFSESRNSSQFIQTQIADSHISAVMSQYFQQQMQAQIILQSENLEKHSQEQQANHLLRDFRKIDRRVQKVVTSTHKRDGNDIHSYQIDEAKFSTNEQFTKLVLGADKVIVDPFYAINYIIDCLKVLDSASFSQFKTLPNAKIITAILDNIEKTKTQSTPSSATKTVTDLSDSLYSLLEKMRNDHSWIFKLNSIIYNDLKLLKDNLHKIINNESVPTPLSVNETTLQSKQKDMAAKEFNGKIASLLEHLTTAYETKSLCYRPGFNGKMPPRDLPNQTFLIIEDYLKTPSWNVLLNPSKQPRQSIVVRYIQEGKFSNTSTNRVFLSDKAAATVKSFKDNKTPIPLLRCSSYPEVAHIFDNIILDASTSEVAPYLFILKVLFRFYLNENKLGIFDWNTDATPLLDYCPDEDQVKVMAKTISSQPVELIFDHHSKMLPILIPTKYIDQLRSSPVAKLISVLEKLGLGRTSVEFVFEEINNQHVLSVYLLVQINSNKYYYAKRDIFKVDSKMLMGYDSADNFMMTALYTNKLNIAPLSSIPTTSSNEHLHHQTGSDEIQKGQDWLIVNMFINEQQKQHHLRLRTAHDQTTGPENKSDYLLEKVIRNYELLIGSIRLFSEIDYETAVTEVDEILNLPHLKELAVLFNADIERLYSLLDGQLKKPDDLDDKCLTLLSKINELTHSESSTATCLKERTPTEQVDNGESISDIVHYRHAQQAKVKKNTYGFEGEACGRLLTPEIALSKLSVSGQFFKHPSKQVATQAGNLQPGVKEAFRYKST